MGKFTDYAAEALGDVTRNAVADIGDSYQEVLTANATVSAPDGLTGTMETVTTEVDTAPQPAPLESYTPEPIDVDMG